ncbi:MAG: DUF1289 domain-containing protein [Burkholderiaceae bacterium]|nr:DUF1289 domain-containing protein [Burkholderiaceae bacterium]
MMNATKLIASYQNQVCHNDQNIPSPCVSVCVMNPGSGLCLGCFRTIDEIAGWSRMADTVKKQVWIQLVKRANTQTCP